MIRKFKYILIIALLFSLSAKAQFGKYPYSLDYYDFVNYSSNELEFFGNHENWDVFYSKLSDLILTGQGQINIVQIGGSHIQADIFSGRLRNRFQELGGEQNAGRGLMFPYRLAKTNIPTGYYFRHTGKWTTCRNVERKKKCKLGLAGITSNTNDTLSSLSLVISKENILDYSFSKLKIFHNTDSLSYEIMIDSSLLKMQFTNLDAGYTEVELNYPVDSLYIGFTKTDSIQTRFQLYGILPESEKQGVVFHNVGINGAGVPSFLRCDLFVQQLREVKPDLVILGLGINDAYGKNFSQSNYENNYDTLINRILQAAPNTAILYLTNNDSYLYRRYVNRNGIKVQKSMKKLALKHNAAVWDMFEVMGGLNSVVLWQRAGLSKTDKIHFTKKGYLFIGDLLFDSIMKSFGNFLEKQGQLIK